MTADRLASWDLVAGAFTVRSASIPAPAWDHPAPCEGWRARDIVEHLVEWVPPFLRAGAGVEIGPGPEVAADPHAAWCHLDAAIRRLLADPASAGGPFEHPQAGSHTLAEAISRFVLGDVLIHTWDLARATGQDDTLEPAAVSEALAGMEPMADALVASGHYGPRREVAPSADEQTRLIALSGRDPDW